MNKRIIAYLFCIFPIFMLFSQEETNLSGNNVLSFEEYIAYVKKHHPVIKQANLVLNTGEAYLLKARGGFDPKLEIDYSNKEFKDLEYYDLLSATFKIPTWFGVEFKANFEENSGVFLNPQNSVPDDGLYAAGVKVSALEGFLINDRMASLKKGRLFIEQTKAERDYLVNELLYEATKAYFEWVKAVNEQQIYTDFLLNADKRFKAIKRNVETGENAAIDSTEAKIIVQNRNLEIEVAKLSQTEKRLKASNYLWLNGIPLELQPSVVPSLPNKLLLSSSSEIKNLIETQFNIEQHPKIQSLNYKVKSLEVDKRLKTNKLLPKLDLEFNFISATPRETSTFNSDEYKASVSFKTPLLLRKERGELRLSKYKLQDANLEQMNMQLALQNKVNLGYNEISSLDKQYAIIQEMVINYKKLVKASERKFFIGESSLLAINLYERKLIDAHLKENSTQIKLLATRAKLFSATGFMQLFISQP